MDRDRYRDLQVLAARACGLLDAMAKLPEHQVAGVIRTPEFERIHEQLRAECAKRYDLD